MADQNMNFTRSRSGYDPQEVDAVIIELQKQIADLKQRNAALSNAVTEYDGKVRQLAENTKLLQDERIQESLRVTGLMNAAAKMAEQTERDALDKADKITENARQEADGIRDIAQQEAARTTENARREAERMLENAKKETDKIRSQAQADFEAIRTALTIISESTQSIHQNNAQYITGTNERIAEINGLVSNALNGIPAVPPLYMAPSIASFPNPPDSSLTQVPEKTAASVPAADPDPYDDFVKNLKLTGRQPQYPPSQKSQ